MFKIEFTTKITNLPNVQSFSSCFVYMCVGYFMSVFGNLVGDIEMFPYESFKGIVSSYAVMLRRMRDVIRKATPLIFIEASIFSFIDP